MKLVDRGEVSNGERPGNAVAQAPGGNSPGRCKRCGEAAAVNDKAGEAFMLIADTVDGEGPAPKLEVAVLVCDTVTVGVTLAPPPLLLGAEPGVDLPVLAAPLAAATANLSGFCLFW